MLLGLKYRFANGRDIRQARGKTTRTIWQGLLILMGDLVQRIGGASERAASVSTSAKAIRPDLSLL